MASSPTDNQSSIGKGSQFFSECREELNKVTYPTKQETIQATLVTLVIVIFIAGCLALMDLLFNSIMGAVL